MPSSASYPACCSPSTARRRCWAGSPSVQAPGWARVVHAVGGVRRQRDHGGGLRPVPLEGAARRRLLPHRERGRVGRDLRVRLPVHRVSGAGTPRSTWPAAARGRADRRASRRRRTSSDASSRRPPPPPPRLPPPSSSRTSTVWSPAATSTAKFPCASGVTGVSRGTPSGGSPSRRTTIASVVRSTPGERGGGPRRGAVGRARTPPRESLPRGATSRVRRDSRRLRGGRGLRRRGDAGVGTRRPARSWRSRRRTAPGARCGREQRQGHALVRRSRVRGARVLPERDVAEVVDGAGFEAHVEHERREAARGEHDARRFWRESVEVPRGPSAQARGRARPPPARRSTFRRSSAVGATVDGRSTRSRTVAARRRVRRRPAAGPRGRRASTVARGDGREFVPPADRPLRRSPRRRRSHRRRGRRGASRPRSRPPRARRDRRRRPLRPASRARARRGPPPRRRSPRRMRRVRDEAGATRTRACPARGPRSAACPRSRRR